MRVTQSMLFGTSAQGLQNRYQKLQQIQEQTVSGKRINRPSDDPSGSFRQVILSSELSGTQSLSSTVGMASGRMSTAEQQITNIHDKMLTAQDMVMSLGNGDQDPKTLQELAPQAMTLYQDVVLAANSQEDGVPLFGGSSSNMPFPDTKPETTGVQLRAQGQGGFQPQSPTDFQAHDLDPKNANYPGTPVSVQMKFITADDPTNKSGNDEFQVTVDGHADPSSPVPFSGTGTVDLGWVKFDANKESQNKDSYTFEVVPSYQGGTADRQVRVADGQKSLPGNVTGSELLKGSGADNRGVDILGTLAGLHGALMRGDPTEVQAWLQKVQTGGEQVADMRSITGSRTAQVNAAKDSLDQMSSSLQGVMATNSDADIFQALTDMEMNNQALQVQTLSDRTLLNTSIINLLQ